ncbi:helix-turn-helix transcriptional regulator [Streptomyces sp. NPDC096310]|uniref:helix-turn-helix transcriptional regulator n=1 Tax=Streptomyces sp. NPDC096310 TaxID=3366082 RepID=UPI003803AC8C
MRADRLVATLLLLQARGRVTATEVAAELAVSERTARRDLEALATAGIPVYPQRGRGGGWALVGGARTGLGGLTVGEIRELFLVPGGAHEGGAPHLRALERAVVDGSQVRLGYERPGGPADEWIVHPLGLATKAGVRYLVASTGTATGSATGTGTATGTRTGSGADRGAGGLRIFRLSRVTSVEPTGDPVVRPERFDLAAAWRSLAATTEERTRAVTVRGRAERGAEAALRALFPGRLRLGGPLAHGWMAFEADGPSPQALAAQLAGLGARIEILAPREARDHLAHLAAELAALYGPPTVPRTG